MTKKPRILLLGATGFVGGWLTRLLLEHEYEVICGVRHIQSAKQHFPQARFVHCDFEKDASMDVWLPRLKEVDVIINCVGIFYHPNKKIMWAIHYDTPKALFLAAEKAKVKQIIHLSALGIEKYQTEYAKSKQATEDLLGSLTLPHVILKPSFIYGPGSRGGMSLIRALSALPFVMPLAGGGKQLFQPIYVEDLVKGMQKLIDVNTRSSLTLAAVSSAKITLKQIMFTLRDWLGLPKAWTLTIPLTFIKAFAWLGNWTPSSTINSEAMSMLSAGNATTSKASQQFSEITGVFPRDFKTGLWKQSATEQERWGAQLFFFPPLLRLSLAIMWLFSAGTSAFYNLPHSYALLDEVGLGFSQPLFLYGAAALNALIGLGLLFNYKIKLNCMIQFLLILLYTLIITIKLPALWFEPFGPVVKNIPIWVSILILYVMES